MNSAKLGLPRRPNIILLNNDAQEFGGLSRVAHLLAREFVGRGYPVMVLGVYESTDPHDYSINGEYGVESLCTPPARDSPPALHSEARKSAVARLRSVLQANTPGICISMQPWATRHLHEAGTQGWRSIAQYHSTAFSPLGERDLPRVKQWSWNFDRLLLLTPEDREEFRRRGLNNTGLMRNPVGRLSDDSSDLRHKSVVYAGRYHEEKSPDFLIRAWPRLVDRFPDWTLDLYGSGPREEEYKGLVSSLGLMGSVVFHDPVPDLEPVFLEASVSALSSQYEGLPMSVLEAMACGVPSVAFDNSPGVRQLVQNEVTGLLVPLNSEEELAGALARLMSDHDLRARFGRHARASAAHYLPRPVVDDWEELFSAVMR